MTRSGAVRLTLLTGVLALLVGGLWSLLAPRPKFVTGPSGLYYVRSLPSEYVAMDGWFAVLSCVAGLVLAIAVVRSVALNRLAMVVVGVLASVGSVAAWRLGILLGPRTHVPRPGEAFGIQRDGPMALTAHGVLAAWPIATLAVLMFVLAWQRPGHDPRPGGETALDDGSPGSVPDDASDTEDSSVGGDGQVSEVGPGQ